MRDQFKLTLDRYNSSDNGQSAQPMGGNTTRVLDGTERPHNETTDMPLYVPKGIKRTTPTENAFFPVAVKKARELRGDPLDDSLVEPEVSAEQGKQPQLPAGDNCSGEIPGSKENTCMDTPGPEQHKRKLTQDQDNELVVWTKNMNRQAENRQSLFKVKQEERAQRESTGIQPQPEGNVVRQPQHQRQQHSICPTTKQIAKSRRKERQNNRRKETIDSHNSTETQKQSQSPGSPGQRH
jgi:hypothetical protein